MTDTPQSRSWVMFILAWIFIVSYFAIHLVINVYFNEQQDSIALTLYGPLSISLCTGLLIYSFGTFIQRTIPNVSICYPGGYAQQFAIFVFALTVIQFTGHAEIVINDTTQWAKVEAGQPILAWIIRVLSVFGFPLMVLSLKILESHQDRINTTMEEHLEIDDDSRSVVKIGGFITWATLSITLLVKLLTAFDIVQMSTDDERFVSKSSIHIFAMIVELGFTLYVFIIHEWGSHR